MMPLCLCLFVCFAVFCLHVRHFQIVAKGVVCLIDDLPAAACTELECNADFINVLALQFQFDNLSITGIFSSRCAMALTLTLLSVSVSWAITCASGSTAFSSA